ncbi:MAG: hypothetical protein LAP85_01680 [Acidobacteriia bacterium]|nr:hypothetical protein [Terriglobia bacterium]
MKRSIAVRCMCALALILCFWVWRERYLSVTHAKAWEWNSFRLSDIASLMISGDLSPQLGPITNAVNNMGIAAIVCGTSLLVPGAFGIIRPASRRLLPVSVVSALVLVLATATLYFEALRLYGMAATPTVAPNGGTYVAAIVAAIEIGAGMIARNAFVPLVARSKP